MNKKLIKYILVLIFIPAVIYMGTKISGDRIYMWVSLCIALIALVPFFTVFEKNNTATSRLVLIAVMTAFSVLGRFVFTFIPFFKPVTAMVVITGIYLGAEAGFLTGALSALISNFLFLQGPWTPYQMFAWGIIGFIAGISSKLFKKSIFIIAAYGAVAGVLYSFILDLNTIMWMDKVFNLKRYLVIISSSAPFTLTYVISNVIFLLALAKPIGKKLRRVTTKFGI
jgi:uncharacterized membrane protein